MLTTLEEKRGVQAIVVVVGHVENADAYRFGMDLAEHYGIGSKEQNSGLLIVLATKDRKYQILTGTGLEGTLPDAICRRVENRLMVPALKRGDWDEAMFTSVKALSNYCMGDKSLVNSGEDLNEDELSQLLGLIIFGFCAFLGSIYVVVNALRTRRTCPQCRNSKLKVVKTRIERGKDKHLYKVLTYRCKKCGYEDEKKYSSYRKNNSNKTVKVLTFNDKIELKDITYNYQNSDKLILDKANMIIPVGKSIGIVGASGSGKTTAVDILLGLLLANEGEVLADGVNVMEHYSEWLSNIGYIPQSIFMLDDDIKSNVAFGVKKEEQDEERVWEALREAQLEDFVRELKDGIHTQIGERGMRLSGGQKQRIGIARALYSNPAVLVFDEATSALDSETEAAVMSSINGLHGKKTMIIIAHRLQTIKECDMVYRVGDGKIVEENL